MRPLTLLAAALLGAAVGCGPTPPKETNEETARTALVAALDAWKAGRTPESLKSLSPPVDFLDLAWQKGAALEGYEIKSQERAGLGIRFTVELRLRQDGGAASRVA